MGTNCCPPTPKGGKGGGKWVSPPEGGSLPIVDSYEKEKAGERHGLRDLISPTSEEDSFPIKKKN